MTKLSHKDPCGRAGWKATTDRVCSCPGGWPKYDDEIQQDNPLKQTEIALDRAREFAQQARTCDERHRARRALIGVLARYRSILNRTLAP